MRLLSISRSAEPSVEPVSLADALNFLRVDNAGEGALVSLLIASARQVVELYTGRALITQAFTLKAPSWEYLYGEAYSAGDLSAAYGQAAYSEPSWIADFRAGNPSVIWLPFAPLVAIASVKYYPADGGSQATFSSGSYTAVCVNDLVSPGGVMLKSTASWPSLADRPDAVEINFTAGHGAAATAVPANLRHAVLILAKSYYDGGREVVDVRQAVSEIPLGVRHMMESRRAGGWIS